MRPAGRRAGADAADDAGGGVGGVPGPLGGPGGRGAGDRALRVGVRHAPSLRRPRPPVRRPAAPAGGRRAAAGGRPARTPASGASSTRSTSPRISPATSRAAAGRRGTSSTAGSGSSSGGGYPATLEDVAAAIDFLQTLDAPLDLARVVTDRSVRRRAPRAVGGDPRGARPCRSRALSRRPGCRTCAPPIATASATGPRREFMGGHAGERSDAYADASPIERLPLGVPQLLVHGEADDVAPPWAEQRRTRRPRGRRATRSTSCCAPARTTSSTPTRRTRRGRTSWGGWSGSGRRRRRTSGPPAPPAPPARSGDRDVLDRRLRAAPGSRRSTRKSMSARTSSSSWRTSSVTCCCSSGGTRSRSDCSSATSACDLSSARRASARRRRPAAAAARALVAASRSAASCVARDALAQVVERVSRLGRGHRRHLQRAVLERGAGGPVVAERRRQHQRPLVAVDADDQLEADLLQRDVALAANGRSSRSARRRAPTRAAGRARACSTPAASPSREQPRRRAGRASPARRPPRRSTARAAPARGRRPPRPRAAAPAGARASRRSTSPTSAREDAVDDDRVGQVAVEVQVGERPPRLVDRPCGRGSSRAAPRRARGRAGSRSSR